MPPLVSIIIPLYNREDLVRETLDSVLAQTYPHWECIVVDDRSTDKSFEVAQSYAAKEQRFKVFQRHREPKGAPTCRNIGLDKAKGEYVIFLDSDDLLADFCLERRVEKYKENPECDFLVFSTLEFKKEINDTNILINVETDQDIIERFLNLDVPFLTTGPVWKKASLINAPKWNESALSWQDLEFHLIAIRSGLKFKCFKDIDNYLRRNGLVETIGINSSSNRHLKSHLLLINRIRPYLKNNKIYLKRLNALTEWIGKKAKERGNRRLAIKAFIQSFKETTSLRPIVNIIFTLNKNKIFWKNKLEPDFGIFRKIPLEKIEKFRKGDAISGNN